MDRNLDSDNSVNDIVNEQNNGFVMFEDYCSSCSLASDKMQQLQNQLNSISRDLKTLHVIVESLVESMKTIQTDQSLMLMRLTNTLIRSGIAFPFVAQPTRMTVPENDCSRRAASGITNDSSLDHHKENNKKN